MYAFGILALLFGAACNNSDNTDPQDNELPGIQPISLADELGTELGEELNVFFERYLPPISGGSSSFRCFFTEYSGVNLLIINSFDELRAHMLASIEPPAIDFDKYTLIIGRTMVTAPGCYVADQNIIVDSENLKLNLIVEQPEIWDAITALQFHWGLYPKLPEMPIEVNVTYTHKGKRL